MSKQIEREIECRICKKILNVKTISSHLRTHNIKFNDYVQQNLEQFPNHQTRPCLICGKETKNEKVCSKKCFKTYSSETYSGENSPMFGVKKSKQHRENISKIKKKLYKDKTKHPMYGKHFTKETKKKMSKSHIKNHKDGKYEFLTGDTNPACRPEVRKKISNAAKKRVGKLNSMYGKTHTPESVKKIFSHRKMNKLEKIVADILDKNNIEYHFQFFIIKDNICKSYDFKIKDKPIIIEVDGDFWHDNKKTIKRKYKFVDAEKTIKNDKLKEELAKNRGYYVHRFWETDIKKDPNIILSVL